MTRKIIKHKGNALIIVLVVAVILIPIGFVMMSRARTNTATTKRLYESFVLDQAARSGIEAIMDMIRQNNFSAGPHSAAVSQGVHYIAYLDVTGIGLIGQKICNLFSKGEGEGGESVVIVKTIEIYPDNNSYLIIPHSHHIIREQVSLDSFADRSALLNYRENDYLAYLNQLEKETKLSPLEFSKKLLELSSQLDSLEATQAFELTIIPNLVSEKSGY